MAFDVSHLSLRVWQRNMDTFFSLWRTESWPPFVEPLLQLAAIGYGVGAYVSGIGEKSYVEFIAPGIIAAAVMFSSSFECLFGTYLRMAWQKTFDAILATPASIDDVTVGELLYGASRGLIAGAGVLTVVALLGLVPLPSMFLALPIAFLAGLMFSAFAVCYTSFAPSFNVFNYYITLFMTPMFLFSGVFFPLEQLPPMARSLSWLSPLTHVVTPMRALSEGGLTASGAAHVGVLALAALAASVLAMLRMRRRLVK